MARLKRSQSDYVAHDRPRKKAYQAKVKQYRKAYTPEPKFYDEPTRESGGSAITLNVSSVPGVLHMNPIPMGPGARQRVGGKIKMTAMQLRGLVYAKSTAQGYNNYGRISIVYDSKPDGGLATYNEIFNTNHAQALTNRDNTDRFKILKTIPIMLSANTATLQVDLPQAMQIDEYIPLRDLKASWLVNSDTSTGAMASQKEGAIYIAYVGNNVGNDGMEAQLTWRINYYDE